MSQPGPDTTLPADDDGHASTRINTPLDTNTNRSRLLRPGNPSQVYKRFHRGQSVSVAHRAGCDAWATYDVLADALANRDRAAHLDAGGTERRGLARTPLAGGSRTGQRDSTESAETRWPVRESCPCRAEAKGFRGTARELTAVPRVVARQVWER